MSAEMTRPYSLCKGIATCELSTCASSRNSCSPALMRCSGGLRDSKRAHWPAQVLGAAVL